VNVQVRRVDATDPQVATRIMQLQREALPTDEPRPLEGDLWWLACIDGRSVGFGAMRILRSTTGPEAYLSRAGVIRAARGRGIQKQLIRARLRHARRLGVTVAITDTADNPASANSLIAEGFRMYTPQRPWALPRSVYWSRDISHTGGRTLAIDKPARGRRP